MTTQLTEPTFRARAKRSQALAVARRRMAARRLRTRRLRQTITTFAVAAFIGPFATLYQQMAEGRDPGLSTTPAKISTALAPNEAAAASTGTAALKTRAQELAQRLAAARRAAAAKQAAAATATTSQTATAS